MAKDLLAEVIDRETTVMFKSEVELEYFARSTLEELICEYTANIVEQQYEETGAYQKITTNIIDKETT